MKAVYVEVWSAASENARWLIAEYCADLSDPEQRVVLEEQMSNAVKAGQYFLAYGAPAEAK